MPGLVIDLFAGGGGASTGIEAALGRPVDIAINHDAVALAVHRANHPKSVHLESDIWEVKPLFATKGRPVDLLWASPDCTHFSVAKGGKPRKQNIRSLAWVVVRWAKEVRPRVICLENVSEFKGWGPLGKDGKPIKGKMGNTFRAWRRKLEGMGYEVDYRVCDASAYGAPTKRRRLFLVARCDGEPIRWPNPTHGKHLLPLATAAECINWSIPCPSIFERWVWNKKKKMWKQRPLVSKTLWRVAQGIKRFVLENPRPFIVKVNHGVDVRTGRREYSMPLAPTLVQIGYGERKGQAARVNSLEAPLNTVVGAKKHALVAAFLAKHFGGVVGQRVDQPASTITAKDHHGLAAATLVKLRGNCHGAQLDLPLPTITAHGMHLGEVRAFLTAYHASDYAGGFGQSLDESMRTVTTKDRLGLVLVEGVEYQIVDIGLRMLEPEELLRAQFGRFAAGYDLSKAVGKKGRYAKGVAVRLIGNSVCPENAEAIVRANAPHLIQRVAA